MKNQADSGYVMLAKLNSGSGMWNSVEMLFAMIVLCLKFVGSSTLDLFAGRLDKIQSKLSSGRVVDKVHSDESYEYPMGIENEKRVHSPQLAVGLASEDNQIFLVLAFEDSPWLVTGSFNPTCIISILLMDDRWVLRCKVNCRAYWPSI